MIKEANIIDGRKISANILKELKNSIDQDNKKNLKPAKLSIILIGDDPASNIYVQNKIKRAKEVGILAELKKFDTNISETELLKNIDILNQDDNVSGIIVQLPLPKHINKARVIGSINPNKDVDGFHPVNVGMLYSPHKHAFVPCTAMGCLSLINSCTDNLVGKHVVIIGRSNIVGRPLAALLLKNDCTVTICHSRTKNLSDITKKADIVISAVGKTNFLTTEYFNENSIVIDVGINRVILPNGEAKLTGDVDFEQVKKKVKFITPVPGGVGPMTVAYLLVNTYKAKSICKNLYVK